MSIRVGTFVFGNDYTDSDNYVELPSYACLLKYSYSAYPTILHKTFDNNGTDGIAYVNTLYKERTLNISFKLEAYEALSMRETIRKFEKEFLIYLRTNGILIFEEEVDKMYLLRIDSLEVDELEDTTATLYLSLSATYPFSVSTAPTTTATNNGDVASDLFQVTIIADGATPVVRPKVTNIDNGQFLGYNATIGNGFPQSVVFNSYDKTITYLTLNRSAYFMPRGTFFKLEPVGLNTLVETADSGDTSLSISVIAYSTYLI